MKEKLERFIQTMSKGMAAARTTADGQLLEGYIVLPADAYEALYASAYEAKNVLTTLKETL